jgi:hypothetical protein
MAKELTVVVKTCWNGSVVSKEREFGSVKTYSPVPFVPAAVM